MKYLSGKRADRGGTKSELQGHSHLSGSLYNGDFPARIAHRSYRRDCIRPAPSSTGESYGTLFQFIK